MNGSLPHHDQPSSRRDFLTRAGGGFGALALSAMLAGDAKASSALLSRPASFTPRAKSVIFLFMDGGPSSLDTFDPKPLVNDYAGQPLPSSVERVITPMGVSENPLLAC